jgi:hypothetical protein
MLVSVGFPLPESAAITILRLHATEPPLQEPDELAPPQTMSCSSA